jgi:hypothetical protein
VTHPSGDLERFRKRLHADPPMAKHGPFAKGIIPRFISTLKEFSSGITAIVALAISGISLYFSYNSGTDTAHVEALKTEYSLFVDLSRAQYEHPTMSHLFAFTPEQYNITSQRVAEFSSSLQKSDRLKLLLEEQGIANYLFTLFEETYFYWKHAQENGDRTRLELLAGDMDFFSQQMCNPRLAWYWDANKGQRMAYNFAPALQKYVQQQLKNRSCTDEDPKGPFG